VIKKMDRDEKNTKKEKTDAKRRIIESLPCTV
jgi:hypothetical protein